AIDRQGQPLAAVASPRPVVYRRCRPRHVSGRRYRDQSGHPGRRRSNVLAGPLRERTVSDEDLAKIERRRAFPTRLTQRLQELLRRQVGRGFGKSGSARPPWPVRLLERTTLLCRLRTRFVGVGIRPERVNTPDVYK